MIKETQFFKDSLNLFIALGPVTKLTRMEPLTQSIARYVLDNYDFFKMIGFRELVPYD